MSRKKDLEAYLKKNALKQDDSKKVTDDGPPQKPFGLTFKDYYLKKAQTLFLYVFMFTSILVVVIAATMINQMDIAPIKAVYLSAVIYALAFASAGIVFAIRFKNYKRWVDSKNYPLAGWIELIAGRTRLYWEEFFFIQISVAVKLADKATALEKDAVVLFMKKWEEDWDVQYTRTNFIKGRPDNLRAKGQSLSGDFSRHQLPLIINFMAFKFLSLAKLLGDNLTRVEITTSGKEIKYATKDEADDAYDVNNSWQARHGE